MTRAVILAGGYGTRMWPLTQRRPKHLLPIGDEPVIACQLRMLADAGARDVVLATAYQADAFRPVLGDGEAFGVRLRYAREDTPLGTGGALAHALSSFPGPVDGPDSASDETVIVLNGDLLTEHDLPAQLAAHRRLGVGVTLHVRHVEDARPYGLVAVSGEQAVAFQEKPTERVSGWINAGTYVLSPRVLAQVPRGVPVSWEREILPSAAARGDVVVYRDEAHFADIGTPAALLSANLRWARARGQDSVVLSEDVAPSAQVRESLVLPGARIEPDAVVESCVLAPGAVVGAGSHLRGCVLGDDAGVHPGAALSDAVLDVGEQR